METATVPSGWTPSQEGRRNEIVAAAASVVAKEGLASCTVRRIAEATPFTKSTIHYYFDDINELTELAVVEVIRGFSVVTRRMMADADRRQSVIVLTRLFIGAEHHAYTASSLLWHDFAVHTLKLARPGALAETFALIADIFEEKVGDRGRALHNYLLGLNFRIRATAPDRSEIATDVSALTGEDITPADLA